jgi:hypothetical protein
MKRWGTPIRKGSLAIAIWAHAKLVVSVRKHKPMSLERALENKRVSVLMKAAK